MKRFLSLLIFLMITMNVISENSRIGIVLGGGGALGFAHIGVLQAFADNGIEFDCVAGASMGAIVGCLYASGKTPRDLMNIVKDEKLNQVLKLLSSSHRTTRTGLSSHNTLIRVLRKLLPSNSFEDLSKPFFVSVTNLTKAQSEIVGSGDNLVSYVVASASVPGVFEVVNINGDQYVDGGVLNNLPAQPLSEMCEVIVGVDVFVHLNSLPPLKRAKEVALHAIRIMQESNSLNGQALCNYLIAPDVLEKFSEFDFNDYQAIYQCGYDATIAFITEHPQILQLKKK